MWVTIVVLGIDPVFQGTAAPSTGEIGSGVYNIRSGNVRSVAFFSMFRWCR